MKADKKVERKADNHRNCRLLFSLDQSYYAFALIRCGEQVRETPLCQITSADTDMYFSEALVL